MRNRWHNFDNMAHLHEIFKPKRNMQENIVAIYIYFLKLL